MIHGAEDHLRACLHVTRCLLGLSYLGVGLASVMRPSPTSISACDSVLSGPVRRVRSRNPHAFALSADQTLVIGRPAACRARLGVREAR